MLEATHSTSTDSCCWPSTTPQPRRWMPLMIFASNRLVWFPVYAVLIGWLDLPLPAPGLLLLPLVLAAVGLADSITSRLFKPFFARLRPCHDAAAGAPAAPARWLRRAVWLSLLARRQLRGPGRFMALRCRQGRFEILKLSVFAWAVLLILQPHVSWGPLPDRCAGRGPAGGAAGLAGGAALTGDWAPRWWSAHFVVTAYHDQPQPTVFVSAVQPRRLGNSEQLAYCAAHSLPAGNRAAVAASARLSRSPTSWTCATTAATRPLLAMPNCCWTPRSKPPIWCW